jgi:hypothetical protein
LFGSASRVPSKYLQTLLLRGAALWLFARLIAVAVVAASAAMGGKEWAIDSNSALLPIWIVLLSPLLVLFDLHRRREVTLLNNLGVTPRFLVVVGAAPPVMFEVILAFMHVVRA